MLAFGTVGRRALKESLGLPFLILFASFVGFGSLARASGFSLDAALVATVGIWGLPGQIALAELYAARVDAFAVILAVSVANARFLPMTVSLMPLLRAGTSRWVYAYGFAYLLSTFSWAAGRRVFPELAPGERPVYFVVYALVCLSGAVLGTWVGFLATASLPAPAALGLLLLAPLFFALVFAGSRERHVIQALLIGAVLGPPLQAVSVEWGVLIAGFLGGTLAFLFAPRSSGPKQ